MDDYEKLADINKKYECLKDTRDNLLGEWPLFRSRISNLLTAKSCGLEEKERQEWVTLLAEAKTESILNTWNTVRDPNVVISLFLIGLISFPDDKDYIILQVLPYICKQRGRVKVGRVTLKPSAQESKDAFILHVAVSIVIVRFFSGPKYSEHEVVLAVIYYSFS